MLRIVRAGGLTVGAGVILGLGVVGWLRLHPAEKAVVRTIGGSVLLNTDPTPSATPEASNLSVLSPATVAANGGGAQSLLGGSSSKSGSVESSSTSQKKLPGP